MNEEELAELGLYNPASPDASERLELLRIAFESGATVDEAREAIAEGRLHAIAAESLIEDVTERLTFDEVATRAGASVEFLRRLWRAFGLSDPEPTARPCSSRDVTAISALGALRDQISEDAALQMARDGRIHVAARRYRRVDGARDRGGAIAHRRRKQRRGRARARPGGRGLHAGVAAGHGRRPPSSRGRSGPPVLALGGAPDGAQHHRRCRRVRRSRRLHHARSAPRPDRGRHPDPALRGARARRDDAPAAQSPCEADRRRGDVRRR